MAWTLECKCKKCGSPVESFNHGREIYVGSTMCHNCFVEMIAAFHLNERMIAKGRPPLREC